MKINHLLLSGILATVMIGMVSAAPISKIQFIGCQRVEPETIESYLPIQVGDEYSQDAVNEALKSLNATGFFEEVNIEINGSILVVKVKEYPIIDKMSFEGNSKLPDKDLNNAINLKAREVLSPTKVKEIQQGMLEAYRKLGRYNAKVSPKIIKLDNNRVNLVFEIDEGVAAGIGKIIFIGNNRYSASDLRDILYTKEKKWYRFFVTDDVYDSERIGEDKVAITRFYRENGYPNARVVSANAELSSNKKEFNLTFVIDEGEVYKVRDVKVKSHIAKLPEKELIDDFYCKKGDVFNSTLIEADLGLVARKAGLKGFSAIKVESDIKQDSKTHTLDIIYNVTQGARVYISKIIIKGNSRTKDRVIRREILLEEGDSFNQVLANLSESHIRSLGFFKSVNIMVIPDPNSPDKCVLEVNVEEASTGEAMIAGSFSTGDGLGVDLTYNERNFLGSGKSLSVYLGSGKTRTGRSYKVHEDGREEKIHRKEKFRILNNVNVTVTDPHIFDKDIEGSVSAFRYQGSKWDAFSTKELGGSCGVSYDLSSRFTQSWEYTGINRKFNDVSEVASPFIKYQTMQKSGDTISATRVGKNNLSSIKHTISFGTQILTGLKGSFKTGLATTMAGAGGNARHFKNELFGTYLIPLSRKTSVTLSASTGLLSKLGNKSPHIIDSFSKGLDSFRGFDDCGVGPFYETTRAIVVDDLLGKKISSYKYRDYAGAKKYWKGTVELTFPIGLPEELQFRGFVFSDVGTLWDAPEKGQKFMKSYTMNSEEATKALTDRGISDAVLIKGFGVKKKDEIKNETIDVCDFDKSVFRHKILDSKKIRASIGLGIAFITPFGPMKFTYAFPIRKEKYDEPYRFLIGFSTTF
ncbi:MAG: outer membrane protein assembly factor BamA [Holosporales bacterium]|jgi:outer membrane protein insertion porin family|nr:outer membrane protein assembly factor BamA [Holosporales bacterium]